MSETCQLCGLPKELCVCETISKEKQKITVFREVRRYGKKMTLIKGLDPKTINIKDITKYLKTKLACGGTLKGDTIELQGDHRQNVKKAMVQKGFPEESISVV